MERIEDKTQKKNWIDGDTFAVKIENYSKEYNGRYLILIKSINDIWKEYLKTEEEFSKEMRNSPLFYVKITKKKKIPKNLEEINKLEFIKTWVVYTDETTKNRVDKGLYSEADDFNYTYNYLYNLLFHRQFDYSNFVYIGNYKVDSPKHEFIPYICYELPGSSTRFDWVSTLINDYENYNLRKSVNHFTEEGAKIFSAKSKADIEFIESSRALAKEVIKRNSELHLYGWGPRLYDCETALNVRADYKKYLRRSKKNNQSNEEMIEELCEYYEEYIKDPVDGPLFWMILADQQLRNNTLTEYQKEVALKSIKKDLKNWKDKENYSVRKEVLDLFKKALEEYIF